LKTSALSYFFLCAANALNQSTTQQYLPGERDFLGSDIQAAGIFYLNYFSASP